MNLLRFIGRLLRIFAIVGLVAALLVPPAAAKRLPVGEMSDMATRDMPCCPDGQKNKNCHDCPLVATCMLTIAQAEPSATNGVQVFFQTRNLPFRLLDLILHP